MILLWVPPAATRSAHSRVWYALTPITSLAAASIVDEAPFYSENIHELLRLQLGHNVDIWSRMRRDAGSSASLCYMPGSGTRRPFRGLTEKNKPRLRDLHSGVTAGGGFSHKGAPICIMMPYVCMCAYACMHIHNTCTLGYRTKSEEHNTYIKRGKRMSGDWRGPTYPWGRRCCQRRPL